MLQRREKGCVVVTRRAKSHVRQNVQIRNKGELPPIIDGTLGPNLDFAAASAVGDPAAAAAAESLTHTRTAVVSARRNELARTRKRVHHHRGTVRDRAQAARIGPPSLLSRTPGCRRTSLALRCRRPRNLG